MRILAHRTRTGLPAMDGARFSAPVRAAPALAYDGRFGAAFLNNLRLPRIPHEVDVPPAPHHVLFVTLRTPRDRRFEARADGRTHRIGGRPDALVLLPAGLASQWRASHGSDMLHLSLSPGFLAELAEEAGLPAARAAVAPRIGFADARLRRLMLQLAAGIGGGAALDALWREQVALLCAMEVLRGAAAPPPPRIGPRRLAALTDRVAALDAAPIPAPRLLPELAAVAGLPRLALLPALRAATGVPMLRQAPGPRGAAPGRTDARASKAIGWRRGRTGKTD